MDRAKCEWLSLEPRNQQAGKAIDNSVMISERPFFVALGRMKDLRWAVPLLPDATAPAAQLEDGSDQSSLPSFERIVRPKTSHWGALAGSELEPTALANHRPPPLSNQPR